MDEEPETLSTLPANTQQNLARDLKRLAPILAIVVVTAVLIALSLRHVGMWHLRNTAFREQHSCQYAEIHFAAALQRIPDLREKAAAIRLAAATADPIALDDPSLGILEGDAALADIRSQLRMALELCPDHVPSHRALALLEWYDGDLVAAQRHLGHYHRLERRFPDARMAFLLAREADPRDMETLIGLTTTYLESGEARRVLDMPPEDHELMKGTIEGRLALGRLYARTGNDAQAQELLMQALLERPSERAAIQDLVATASRVGNLREVADFLMTLGEEGRRTVTETYHHASIIYARLNEWGDQERALRRALALFPNHADLNFDLAVCLYRQGRRAEARDQVKRAAEYDVRAVMRGIERTGVDPRDGS